MTLSEVELALMRRQYVKKTYDVERTSKWRRCNANSNIDVITYTMSFAAGTCVKCWFTLNFSPLLQRG